MWFSSRARRVGQVCGTRSQGACGSRFTTIGRAKVRWSRLWGAVEGRFVIYIHEERMLADVERHYPARRYVMVDDKLRILAAMKNVWGDRLTTVFPRQGHYALDPAIGAAYPAAAITIERIGEMVRYALGDLMMIWRINQ